VREEPAAVERAEPAERVSVTVEEARALVLDSIRPLGPERVALRQAHGRVLLEDVAATRPIPPLDNSAMDGFAVRAEDTRRVPAPLKLIDEIPAGQRSRRPVGAGEVARILTGAPIPAGADAVVMQEYAERDGDTVHVLRSVVPGENVRFAGADVVPGQLVVAAGSVLGPAHVGMLAALGRASVSVSQRARVAVLATGDEIVEPERLGDADDGRIASSNSYSLQAAIAAIGAEPVYLGIAPDRPEAIEELLREALRCDAVVTTGGVSVGDHDYVKGAMARIGSTLRLWQVRMKPGAPLAFALVGDTPLFGLPGNPVSSLVSFEEFVRPALLRLQNHLRLYRPIEYATLVEAYRKPAGRTHFARVTIEARDGRRYARLTGDQSSGVLLSMLRADGLAIVPADVTEVPAGTDVPVQLLGRDDLREEPGF
jgi:molybdopterin molybdotransferase